MKLLPVNQWVAAAMEAGGLSQAELSRKLSRELRRDIDRAAVNKLVKGTRDLAADEMLAIETITAFPVPSPHVGARVPLISWVSAGKLAEPATQIAKNDAPLLAIPDLGPGDFFALRVEGDSMDRLAPPGTIILVNRKDRELQQNRCYIFALRGETTFKRWHAEPPFLSPFSTNPAHEPIFVKNAKDLEVVGRVRRSMLDL